jgi:osmoprotectant transport system ATP-binding protein
MSSIVIHNLVKQFPNVARPAVAGINLDIQAGSFVVLLGPSGCGKTTLLKMINRLYEPTSGNILIDGVDVVSLPATELRRKIGYVIQQNGLFPHMRIEQNIAVVPELLGWERNRIDARIDELLQLVGLPLDYRRRYPRQLSGGEQQRVGLARALAADPQLMLMDEPFGALDAITRGRLQDELLSIQRQLKKTVLFVTHDVEEALRLADVIVVMRLGHVVQSAAPRELLSNPHDDFVRTLVGADDLLRRLSVIPVSSAARANGHLDTAQAVTLDDNLRTALLTLLRGTANTLAVTDTTGQQIGSVSLSDIRAALVNDSNAVDQP